ncbi:hypothetical protein PSL48_17850 [Clostridioides difficile]|uniref:hypothetical protein n=1 Tax=Clostridioides difficile TaxID=1496 RepID=UPI00235937C4|nr:hypothetical protein [Clostridioides difficile]MDC9287867.1 hypothetical protein [Clostridioides difficile]
MKFQGKDIKRELVEVGGAVGIVAITDDNKVVLVKQFRKPIEKPIRKYIRPIDLGRIF